MAAQQPFHPIVADFFSGGVPSTHSEGISSGKGLAVEMHLGSPGLNPGGEGLVKNCISPRDLLFFFFKSSFHHRDLLVLAWYIQKIF